MVAFFARQLLEDLRLAGGYDVLYGKVKGFMREHLFSAAVDLEDPVVLRNLSEPEVGKILYDSFKVAINALTVQRPERPESKIVFACATRARSAPTVAPPSRA